MLGRRATTGAATAPRSANRECTDRMGTFIPHCDRRLPPSWPLRARRIKGGIKKAAQAAAKIISNTDVTNLGGPLQSKW